MREGEILKALTESGCNVPTYYDSWVESKHSVIIMDYCQFTLSNKASWLQASKVGFSEGEIRKLITQVVPAITRLHNLGHAHMDLKPGKVMFI